MFRNPTDRLYRRAVLPFAAIPQISLAEPPFPPDPVALWPRGPDRTDIERISLLYPRRPQRIRLLPAHVRQGARPPDLRRVRSVRGAERYGNQPWFSSGHRRIPIIDLPAGIPFLDRAFALAQWKC